MKKIKLNTAKLQLSRERILSLTDQDAEMVKGGTSQSLTLTRTTNTLVPAPPQTEPQLAPESRKDVLCTTVSLALGC